MCQAGRGVKGRGDDTSPKSLSRMRLQMEHFNTLTYTQDITKKSKVSLLINLTLVAQQYSQMILIIHI